MRRALVPAALALLCGCSALPPVAGTPAAPDAAISVPSVASHPRSAPAARRDPGDVGAVLMPGRPPVAAAPAVAAERPLRPGDVSLDYPGVDVQAVARAVLGDLLRLPYSLAPDIHTPITLAPGRPIARADVLRALELALQPAGLALTVQAGGGYAILPVAQARAVAPVGAGAGPGFASEVIALRFVNADDMRRLVEPVLPGVVTAADPGANTLTVAGASGQRAAVRDLVRQFDVDWLRGMSFGLFTPHRTDARLIVPELDKVLNADGAPTKGLVRLIAMDRLNGILAVSIQPQYLEDVRRWVEVLDRQGETNERRIYVYRVQNGRSSDLARTLAAAFGGQAGPGGGRGVATDGLRSDSDIAGGGGQLGIQSFQRPGQAPAADAAQAGAPYSGAPSGGAAGVLGAGLGPPGGGGDPGGGGGGLAGGGAAPVSVDVRTDDFRAKITSDDVNNAIVVYATPRDYAVVEEALRQLDVAPTQVLIEAAIAEVTLTDNLRFGVQGLYNNAGLSVGLTESATSAAPIARFPGFSALYAARTVSAALNALEGLTKVKVVSAPKLMVLNNQTASIQVGSEVPILTGSATNVVTSNAAVVNSIDYRDTGIILKVTPRVNSSGAVLLDIAQEVSDVVSATTTAQIQSPTFSDRKIVTAINAQDGEVIALGGLIRDNRTDTRSGLPLLSRVPVLGPLLFGDLANLGERTELIVLLRPRVVRSVDDGRQVSDDLRDKLQALRSLLPAGRMP